MRNRYWPVILFAVAALGIGARAADPPHYHELARVTLDGPEGWDCLAVDAAAHRLYVTRGTRVVVVDTETRKVVGEVKNTPGVHGVAVDRANGHGFTSNGQEDTVTVFDTKTLEEISRLKVGKRPDIIIYDPSSRRVFSFNAGSQDATAIDAATLKVVGTVMLGGKPEFAVADRSGGVFVNLEDKSEIVSFDENTLAVKARWGLAPGEEPTGLAFDRVHHRLFSACANKKMIVLDSETGKVVATPEVGGGPDGAVFDAETGLAFCPNGKDGTLTVIHEDAPDTYRVVETVPTQSGARTIAIDRATHQLYLVTARPAPAVAGQRRTFVPGSFVVLIYGP